jgi:hypothetical protein
MEVFHMKHPKIAICCTLQPSAEQNSPDTPMDCFRLTGYIYNRLCVLFPDLEIEMFNRADFPGTGDDYLELRQATVAWGADMALHVHQDAADPTARGWHIIYYHPEAMSLVDELWWALKNVDSPMRYGGIVNRKDVAAVKKPLVSVLVEFGFYTNVEDENLGIDDWGNAAVTGVVNYVRHNWYIQPEKEEDIDMIREGCKEAMDHSFLDVWTSKFEKIWLHIQAGTLTWDPKKPVTKVYLYLTKDQDNGGYYKACPTILELRATKDYPNPYLKVNLKQIAADMGMEDFTLAIHAEKSVFAALREV